MSGSPPQAGSVSAPVIGVRYWFRDRLGVDAGLGFGALFGSQEVNQNGGSTTSNTPSSFGIAFHAGLPIALLSVSHYVFEVVPEATVGFTNGTLRGMPTGPDQSVGGFRLDVGARVGSEIHFGFMGLPQVALEASLGLYFRRATFNWSQGGDSSSVTSNSLTTSVVGEPWAYLRRQYCGALLLLTRT
jgi:hypothetical protein